MPFYSRSYIFIQGCLPTSNLKAQKKEKSGISKNSCVVDSVFKTNTNTVVYALVKGELQKTEFLRNFKLQEISIELKKKCNDIQMTIRYAPRYLDYDIIHAKYDYDRQDWFLSSLLTHRFSPIDKNLITIECCYRLCEKIWLRKESFNKISKTIDEANVGKLYTVQCKDIEEEAQLE